MTVTEDATRPPAIRQTPHDDVRAKPVEVAILGSLRSRRRGRGRSRCARRAVNGDFGLRQQGGRHARSALTAPGGCHIWTMGPTADGGATGGG